MCRFVAYLGTPISPEVIAYGGDHSLYRQSWAPKELLSGSVNADGFGAAWYVEDLPVRVSTDRPIWHEPELQPLLRSVSSTTMVAALRNATEGLPVDRVSVAPLVFERWTFTLNGFITGFRAEFMREFRQELPDDLYAEIRGCSDTETLFFLLVDRLRRGTDPGSAVRDLIGWVQARVGAKEREAQLNLVLTTPDRVVATRFGTTGESNSLYAHRSWRDAPGGVLLASEALDGDEGWQVIPHQSIVEAVDGEGLRINSLA
jgi:gamma-glutamyl hercynylcysteine S-oxide hydrolase